jgi:Domain of unknown function (DU1801)
MAELKTKQNEESVTNFLNLVENPVKRKDCFAMADLMKKVSGCNPKMWGTAIVGFDSYHYKYESGREGDMCIIGFSPRKQNITLYLMGAIITRQDLLDKLGKYKASKGCLYIDKLTDVDTKVLEKLIKSAIDYIKKKYK